MVAEDYRLHHGTVCPLARCYRDIMRLLVAFLAVGLIVLAYDPTLLPGLFAVGLVIFLISLAVAFVMRAVWRVGTVDWFGIRNGDPTSPYYHDKTGEGRGR